MLWAFKLGAKNLRSITLKTGAHKVKDTQGRGMGGDVMFDI